MTSYLEISVSLLILLINVHVLTNQFILPIFFQNDLVRRLRKVGDALADEDVEPNSPDYPGLGGLAAVLVEDKYLKHRDKEVRLYTVLACIEILYLVSVFPNTMHDLFFLNSCMNRSFSHVSFISCVLVCT